MKAKNILPLICMICFANYLAAQTPNKTIAAVNLKVAIAGKTEGNITMEEFFSDSIIHVLPENAGYIVASYKFSVYGKDGEGKEISYTEMPEQGNRIGDVFRAIVSKLTPGSKVYVEYVKGKLSKSTDATQRALAPLALKISEK